MGIKHHGKESGKTQRIHASDKIGLQDVFNQQQNKRLRHLEGELKQISEEMDHHPHSDASDESENDSYSVDYETGKRSKGKHSRRKNKQKL